MRVFLLIFAVSVITTGGLRILLPRLGMMDLPNARSSHSIPIPRGGGLAIVMVFLSAVALAWEKRHIPAPLAWALIGGGFAIAIAGILDDRFGLAAWPRVFVQSLASAWAIWCLNGLPSEHIGGSGDFWAWAHRCAALATLVWLTNLFNFMDGIDGLAGIEAACVSGLGAILLLENGWADGAQLSLMLCAASLGFLVWNWPPAKIFMGDTGSGFLGFTLGTLALFSLRANPVLAWTWLILLAAFLADATITLLRRMIRRARWYEAHRNHAYQHAARAYGSHARVTVATAAINVGWLFPLAWAASRYPHTAPILAAAAVAPLGYLAFRFQAGRESPSSKLASQA